MSLGLVYPGAAASGVHKWHMLLCAHVRSWEIYLWTLPMAPRGPSFTCKCHITWCRCQLSYTSQPPKLLISLFYFNVFEKSEMLSGCWVRFWFIFFRIDKTNHHMKLVSTLLLKYLIYYLCHVLITVSLPLGLLLGSTLTLLVLMDSSHSVLSKFIEIGPLLCICQPYPISHD